MTTDTEITKKEIDMTVTTTSNNNNNQQDNAKQEVEDDQQVGTQSWRKNIQEQQHKTRKEVEAQNVIFLVIINTLSAITVFILHLISIESLISIALSVGITIYTYHQTQSNNNVDPFDGSIMNWVLLSFAIITPITSAISMAFTRREKALVHIAILRSTLLQIYTAHAVWDWGFKKMDDPTSTARQQPDGIVDWLEHSDKVGREILLIGKALCYCLALPNCTRARHKLTSLGKKQASQIRFVGKEWNHYISQRLVELSKLCEVMKQQGMPPNEGIRIRQWERMVSEQVDNLIQLKLYRTPQALRSFARLFSMFLPPFYAPYYAEMAARLNSLGMAIAFAVITSIALTALFETSSQMEDPFVATSILDGVHIQQDLVDDLFQRFLITRKSVFPNASDFELPVDGLLADKFDNGDNSNDGDGAKHGSSVPTLLTGIRFFKED